MSLSPARLQVNFFNDYLERLQNYFPVSNSLKSAEQTLLNNSQVNMAKVLSDKAAGDIITEVKLGVVNTTVTTNDAQGGTNTGTGTGAVS